ncbi:MAG: class I SAM-dependent methyltransferase, partial [Nitrosotalea sp.]
MNQRDRIKQKILCINSKRWWGDDFDVRFYLISLINKFKNKKILDVGGGIGIISSELDSSNLRVNLDSSLEDLKSCKTNFPDIIPVCASMYHLPFRDGVFDVVILSNV